MALLFTFEKVDVGAVVPEMQETVMPCAIMYANSLFVSVGY